MSRWRVLMAGTALGLAALGLAGCQNDSPSSAIASSTTVTEESASVMCQCAAKFIAEGALAQAEAQAKKVRATQFSCGTDLMALIAERRKQADTLVDQALAADEANRVALLRSALILDAGNARALAVLNGLSSLQSASPSTTQVTAGTSGDTPASPDQAQSKTPSTSPTPVPTPSTSATRNSSSAVVTAAASQNLDPLIAVAIAFAIGALIARFLPIWWVVKLRYPRRVLGFVALVLGVLVGCAAYAWPVLSSADWGSPECLGWVRQVMTWPPLAAPRIWLLSAAAGALAMTYLKAVAPATISVTAQSDEADEAGVADAAFAGLVVSEMRTVAGSAPAGVWGVNGGTDLQTDVGTALAQVTNAAMKVLIALWKVATTGLGDRITIRLLGTEADRQAIVRFERGTRLLDEGMVSAKSFLVDPKKVTDEERTAFNQDLATGVAARLVLASLRVHPGMSRRRLRGRPIGRASRRVHRGMSLGWFRAGLYGARVPGSVALCAVAARRADHASGLALYANARHIDNDNLVARFGLAVSRDNVTDASDSADALASLTVVADQAGYRPLRWRAQYAKAAIRINRFWEDPGKLSIGVLELRMLRYELAVDLETVRTYRPDVQDLDPVKRARTVTRCWSPRSRALRRTIDRYAQSALEALPK